MYLPMVGLILIVCEAVSFLDRKTAVWLLSAVLFCCAILTVHRNRQWGDPIRFWMANIEQEPGKVRLYRNLAETAVDTNRCSEVLPLFPAWNRDSRATPAFKPPLPGHCNASADWKTP